MANNVALKGLPYTNRYNQTGHIICLLKITVFSNKKRD